MKGKKKYIMPLLLAGVTATAGVVTEFKQQETMVQASEVSTISDVVGARIEVLGGFDDDGYMLGTEGGIAMPTVRLNGYAYDASNWAGYTVTYTISRGSKVFKTIVADDDVEKFVPKYTGDYDVTITAEKEGQVVSKLTGLTITVTRPDAVINLPVNSEYVIPAQIKVGETNLKIPVPEVETVNAEGEEVTYKGQEAINKGLKVSLVTPTEDGTKALDAEHYNSETNTYNVPADLLDTAGTYKIRYEFSSGSVIISKLETGIQVVDVEDFTAPTNLYMKLSGSVPATGNVNTEIKIPSVSVYDSKSATDAINAHVSVSVIKLDANGKEEKTIKLNDAENTKFVPEEEGNYIIAYTADLKQLYGDKLVSTYKPSTIISVVDNKAPEVLPTYNYAVVDGEVTGVYYKGESEPTTLESLDKTAKEVLVNRKVDVPTVAVLDSNGDAKFTLPAIFATDNKYGYGDIELTRQVAGNGTATYTVKNDANVTSEEITLNKLGTYEVRYIAKEIKGKDADGKNIYGKETKATFTLTVVDEATAKKEKGTTVKLNLNLSTSTVSQKDIIKFAPTAEDGLDDFVEVVSSVELLKDKVGGAEGEKEVIATISQKDLKVNADGKYEISVKDILSNTNYAGVQYINVKASAYLDSTLEGVRSTEKIENKIITINDTTEDSTVAGLTVGLANPAYEEGNGEEKYLFNDMTVTNWNKSLLEQNADKLIKYNGKTDISSKISGIDEAGYIVGSGVVADNDRFKTEEGGLLAAFNQNDGNLTLPSIKFTDNDENLKVNVSIFNSAGNAVVKYDAGEVYRKQVGSNWEHTIEGITFKMAYSDVYTVVYRAEDSRGNIMLQSFGIRVNDTTPPSIDLEDTDKFGMEIEVGDFFEVPTGMLKKGTTDLTERDVYWQVKYSDGADCDIQATGFTPLTEGTFYIKYYGTDSMGNYNELSDSSLYFVTAKDTTAPEFDESYENDLDEVMAWEKDAEGKNVSQMTIDIPEVYATDPIRGGSVDVKYNVTGPDGSKVTLSTYPAEGETGYDATKDGFRKFVATKQGIYTVEYTATDAAGNTSTLKKTVALGDCVAPTISWANEKQNIPTEVALNGTFELKLSDLTLKDNVTSPDKVNMKIKLLKPDNTTEVTSTGNAGKTYKWQLTETGSYTLNITVTDEAGMDRTYKYTINVPSEDVETNEISPVWGTVLVVASVVILAGVVIYFVVSSKKKTPAKGSRARKND